MEKVAFASILKKCRYFVELEPVFGTRHANVRLAAAHGLPAPTQNLESEVQMERDSREHSVNSNVVYEELQSRSMQEALSTNAVEDGLNSSSEEPTMEDFMNVLNDNDEIPDDGQIPYTPTPFRPRDSFQAQSETQTTSSSLKRTGSRNSVDSTSVGTFSKRSRTSGSASSIQALLQGNQFGSTPLQASSNVRADPNLNTLEQQAFFKHGQSMERLAQVVENMGSSICGQQPKQTEFSPEEAKKKSQIELELVDVKLSSDKFDLDSRKEKHSLEMKQMKAEYEHQQVARNAHLISTLMKDHNLSLQDAMLAAQHAQSMMQSSSASGSGV
ncbi:uncharacterized protein MELLADRAFT_92967 [Melampsora larici-populina 98AG31]|uniref:Uncharacterized protein n=2 Tax=Melampsora larici-populina (strain 98AG31 / pathotype 3-4-7) TaxID=747676 RepID=F4S3E6_MELLP|nr:uncharacterized protein MELLADRAFT_92967 [Melampsora larici-populina 98AG31]EGG00850.1 hypothetical protein MELLADRAFT_92967 [Melampsora larici-populina 98AG31]